MKKIEIVLFAIYFLFSILAYFDVAGMEPLMILIYSVTGLTYLIFSFILFKYKSNDVKEENLLISMIGGVYIFLTILGTIFKQMMWPGAAVFMLIGVVALLFVMTPLCIYRLKKGELIVIISLQ